MPKWEQAALCCPQLRTCYGSLHRVTGGEVRRNLQSSSGLAQMEPPVLHFVPSASCPYLSSRRLLNLLLKLAFEAARQWLFFFNSPNYVAYFLPLSECRAQLQTKVQNEDRYEKPQGDSLLQDAIPLVCYLQPYSNFKMVHLTRL